ncbi:MAG: hypothetical protein Q9195_005513 [Heterodermia aff. obscurata]
MAAVVNGSFASPLANAHYPSTSAFPSNGLFFQLYNGMNAVSLIMSALLMLVAYDQCSIVGPAWKAPFVGPFLDSVNPKMDKYKAKWASGDLSCVSVFHK